ncbi:Riboflavin kinase [[Candida] zeylanoides]|jgi:riboflavin kinase
MRPQSNIPESPQPPFPVVQQSRIVKGFGRGSSELGIPTANVPISAQLNALDTGIYFGWCQLVPGDLEPHQEKRNDGKTVDFNNGMHLAGDELGALPMVMSIGWNPFYQNTEKAAEIHIMHQFRGDFYGARVKYAVLGYIRPELNYTTKDALIEDIKIDIATARQALAAPGYQPWAAQLEAVATQESD